MDAVLEIFRNLWDNIVVLATSGNPILSIIDIIIVTFIIYKALQFLRDTRAEQLIKGIAVFLVALGVAKLLDLKALMWLLDTVYINLIVVVVVLFQPELRSILEYVGRGSVKHFGKLVNRTQIEETPDHSVDAICSACQSMQVEKIGALIVIERDTALNEIAETGTIIEAEPSKELICNVFFPKSPLHDGAMIVRNGKIYAVGCILPFSPVFCIRSMFFRVTERSPFRVTLFKILGKSQSAPPSAMTVISPFSVLWRLWPPA